MEINDKWIGKIAGWKVFKTGRDAWKDGIVKSIDNSEAPEVIVGLLGAGDKKRKVTVRILGENEVETHCNCMHARRTGEVCSHAVAVLLYAANGEAEVTQEWVEEENKAEEPKFEPSALKVNLAEDFLSPSKNSMAVFFQKIQGQEVSAMDIKLCAWFYSIGLLDIPVHLSIQKGYFSDFLAALEGNEYVYCAEQKMQIVAGGMRFPVSAEVSDTEVKIILVSTDERELIHIGGSAVYWSSEEKQITLPKVNKSLVNDRQLNTLLEKQPMGIEIKAFLRDFDAWENTFDWGISSITEQLRVLPAQVSFVLNVKGNIKKITASLQARYPGGITIDIAQGGKAEESLKFPFRDRNHKGVWLTRNFALEKSAKEVMREAGFCLETNAWVLSPEEQVLDFLGGGLKDEDIHISVKLDHRLESISENIVRVTPELNIEGSGEDWLAFDYGYKADTGKSIPREMIEKMLKAGKRTASTKNGKRIVISAFDANVMSEVLVDVNPSQQQGKYYVSAQQGAYIKRIKKFYGKSLEVSTSSAIEKLPHPIIKLLRDYQKEGVSWLYSRVKNESSALLADDMGLGKTLQTLCSLYLLKQQSTQEKPSLIVCPTSLLENWRDEVIKFFSQWEVTILHGSDRQSLYKKIRGSNIVVTSYGVVSRDFESLKLQSFDCVVIDEASVIRNPDTKIAKALRQLQIGKRLALTGTPLENSLADLWSIFEFLMPGYLGKREEFTSRYVKSTQGSQPNYAVLKRLRLRIEPFLLRRTKREVASDLPPKIQQVLWCEPSSSQRELYQKLHKVGVEQVAEARKKSAGQGRLQMLTVLLRMRQACCDIRLLNKEDTSLPLEDVSAKLVQLIQLLKQAQAGGHRVLVFSQFTSMLSLIKDALNEEQLSFCYLDGSTRNRGEQVKKFQSNTGPLAFLISLKAGGYGLNLTAADIVVHFDPWWNPAVEAQATDRAYRIGQTKTVNVYKLVTKNTVEEKILQLQEKKQLMLNATIDEKMHMSGLTDNEVSSLIF